MDATRAAMRLEDLSVRIAGGPEIVSDVHLNLARGEILAIVGETGSGKTTTALALLGYHAPGVEIESGSLDIDGRVLPVGVALRALRGKHISYVPQNPGPSLNPTLRVADAIGDLLRHHFGSASPDRIRDLLRAVGLDGVSNVLRRYPHQLSGGEQRRVGIAIALACDPSIIVLDEPTAGLDVAARDQILNELGRLREERGVSIVCVTHDLAVAAGLADRVAVMYAGRIVEQGKTAAVLRNPQHPYTRGLICAMPDHLQPGRAVPIRGIQLSPAERHPVGCAFSNRCDHVMPTCRTRPVELRTVFADRQVRCDRWPVALSPARVREPVVVEPNEAGRVNVVEVNRLEVAYRSSSEVIPIAAGINLAVERGTCLALVGESGSGKTTIARAVAGLHPPTSGSILLHGQVLAGRARDRTSEQRRQIQMVFQSSVEALNPHERIRDAVARPAKLLRGFRGSEVDHEVGRLLELVRLPARAGALYPAEMSGGEKQRAAIARALAAGPAMLLCDEITSALDASVQAAVIAVLADLRTELGVSMLVITHDPGIASSLAERMVVLADGAICEQGNTAALLNSPRHEYTQRLVGHLPSTSHIRP